eukprot:CAMPEP_0115380786 /NCGR_PEP_ID=MMETSP0271-20121206/5230_1 /TAXON_ID=71861 /ORGANISM="Scrippsiella trochoidea, Strain CCMP3099" /LENGTH=336 /DNA_ID=CAMNT_0002804037 /DNA_START=54 /DNA_END=1065 /DNA_ORIENTATION=-
MSALSLQGHAGMLVGFAMCLVVVVPLSGAPTCSSNDSCARDSVLLQLQQNQSDQFHKASAESALPPFQLPDFRLVNGQEDRACRGGCPSDIDESYYQLRVAVSTLDECQCLCRDDVRCSGVEYNSNGHCKLWHRNGGIMFTAPAEGYSCYRNSFQPVAGGVDRSCRGDGESDDDERYYDVTDRVPSQSARRCASKHVVARASSTPPMAAVRYGSAASMPQHLAQVAVAWSSPLRMRSGHRIGAIPSTLRVSSARARAPLSVGLCLKIAAPPLVRIRMMRAKKVVRHCARMRATKRIGRLVPRGWIIVRQGVQSSFTDAIERCFVFQQEVCTVGALG